MEVVETRAPYALWDRPCRNVLKNSIWALASCIALTTDRYLLVDRNYHYPFLLLCIQGAVALCLSLLHHLLFKSRNGHIQLGWTDSQDNAHAPLPTLTLSLKTCATVLSGSFSMMFTIQALLHWPNFSTLCMAAVIVFLCDLAFLQMISRRARETRVFLPLAVLGLACALLMYDDYRLMVSGIVSLSLASILAGASRSLSRKGENSDLIESGLSSSILRTLTIFVAIVLSAILSFTRENVIVAIHGLFQQSFPVLLLNISSNAVAIYLGLSILAPLNINREADPSHDETATSLHQVAATVTCAAVGSAISLCFTPRPYTSSVQFLWYVVALLCLVWISNIENKQHNTSLPQEDDTESQYLVLETFSDRQGLFRSMSRMETLPTVNTLLLGAAVWIFFFLGNFDFELYDSSETPGRRLNLDQSFVPASTFDIVVSMYKEPVESVSEILSKILDIPSIGSAQPRIFIYTKDEDVEEHDLPSLQNATRSFNVTKLPNRGREGSTYLHHITSRWNDLANHTMFIQADVHNPREFLPRVRDFYSPNTGMLSLGFPGIVCDLDDCSDRWGWTETPQILSRFCDRVYNGACDEKLLLSYKGQFIVSGARIRGIDKGIYEDLYTAMNDPNSWAHQETYLQGRPDSLNAPRFGYTLERMWSMLFQCSDLEVVWKCPSLLSGWRRGGDMGDCQCYD